jgi:hypothetical protein
MQFITAENVVFNHMKCVAIFIQMIKMVFKLDRLYCTTTWQNMYSNNTNIKKNNKCLHEGQIRVSKLQRLFEVGLDSEYFKDL